MASRRKYRNTYKRWHKQYERFAFREFQKTLNKWSNNIPWSALKEFNYKAQVKEAINTEWMLETLNGVYFNIGMRHGFRVGNGINKELKEFTTDAFTPKFLNELNIYLQRYGLSKATTIGSTYFEEIIRLLQDRLEKGQTIEQAQREIRRIVQMPSFNRMQAIRIARTETTAAANFAATQASTVSGFVMQKEWISARDSRTRRRPESFYDHYHVNGQRVPEGQPFLVSGELLQYPGDPKGSAGNIINCRCAVAVIPVRDSNGELIPIG